MSSTENPLNALVCSNMMLTFPGAVPALRLEVDGGLEGAVHVEGRGVVLVGDPPRAAGLAQAHGRAEPQFEALLGAVRRRGEAVQAVAGRDIFAGGHRTVA